MRRTEEAQLLAAARTGDTAAFGSLVSSCDDMMRGVAYRLMGHQASMDDVLQEAYLKAFRSLAGFDERAAFSTWLHVIVQRTCLDAIRRDARRAEVRLVEDEVGASTSPPAAERMPLIDELTLALRSLPVEQSAVVILVDSEGLTYDEVAEVLGISPGTVASRLSRGRASLRTLLSHNRGELR